MTSLTCYKSFNNLNNNSKLIKKDGNRLLNWPKLLGLYIMTTVFSSIFVPE